VYRGVIIDILGRWFSSFVCVGASALVFSLVHIPEGFVDFLLVFLVGVCFGVVYIVDGNLIPSTIAHSLSNAAVLIFIR
jgi:membrane protease YdiL (CAAX protease family)